MVLNILVWGVFLCITGIDKRHCKDKQEEDESLFLGQARHQ